MASASPSPGSRRRRFDVQIVPFTWSHTNLRSVRDGRSRQPGMRHGRQVRAPRGGADGDEGMTAPLKIAKGTQEDPGRSPASRTPSRRSAPARSSSSCDDEDRENEGDLTLAAEKVTPKAINFMAKYGRGLICMPMTRRAPRRARDSVDGQSEHRAARHGVLRDDRSEALDEHRHLRGRSREHGARRHRPADEAVGPRAARPHVSAARAIRAACSCAPGRRKRRSIWRGSAGCIPPASSAKS